VSAADDDANAASSLLLLLQAAWCAPVKGMIPADHPINRFCTAVTASLNPNMPTCGRRPRLALKLSAHKWNDHGRRCFRLRATAEGNAKEPEATTSFWTRAGMKFCVQKLLDHGEVDDRIKQAMLQHRALIDTL
jgi:hypothetical protein